MNKKELTILLKDYLKNDTEIYKTYEDNNYMYVFTVSKELKYTINDDRNAITGGQGFIRIDKKTKQYRRLPHILFPTELFEIDPKPTLESIANGIIKREYVNEKDMYDFIELVYVGEREKYFDFGRVLYDYKINREKIIVHFKEESILTKFKEFLTSLNVENKVNEKGWLEIIRVPIK